MKPIKDYDQNVSADVHVTVETAALPATTVPNATASLVEPRINPDIYLVYPESDGYPVNPYGQH